MTLPSDSQQANHDAKVDRSTRSEYELLGRFEPRDGERIVKGLEEQHLSFEVQECREIRLYWPRSLLCIYVCPEDKKKAEAISDQDSARSRAKAGICYAVVGGLICTVALLQMRSGVSTIPYYRGGGPISLEMVAGFAGFVVFLGILQLVIAFILKVRGRRRSRLVQPSHLTTR